MSAVHYSQWVGQVRFAGALTAIRHSQWVDHVPLESKLFILGCSCFTCLCFE